jgi:pimeloyl-ACP methyl ester carboxylesterase
LLPRVFLLHAVGGDILGYNELLRHLPVDQCVYAFRARGLDDTSSLAPIADMDEMARLYAAMLVQHLRATSSSTEQAQPICVRLGGHSFGGTLAACMLRHLWLASTVAHMRLDVSLFLLDSPLGANVDTDGNGPAIVGSRMDVLWYLLGRSLNYDKIAWTARVEPHQHSLVSTLAALQTAHASDARYTHILAGAASITDRVIDVWMAHMQALANVRPQHMFPVEMLQELDGKDALFTLARSVLFVKPTTGNEFTPLTFQFPWVTLFASLHALQPPLQLHVHTVTASNCDHLSMIRLPLCAAQVASYISFA